MNVMIHVRPARERRRDFARWATGHTPKIRTVGIGVFAVPPRLFTDTPEELLVGALVDGHRYRSPLEDEAAGVVPPGAPPVPETVAMRTAVPGEALPPADESGYGPDSVPLPEPSDDEPGPEPDAAPSEGEGVAFACDVCSRTFGTARGRDTHRRQAHTED